MRVLNFASGAFAMAPGTVPARTSRIIPFVDEAESLDWDYCLDKLPPPLAEGSIVVELTRKAASEDRA
jgi:hypothetical protein